MSEQVGHRGRCCVREIGWATLALRQTGRPHVRDCDDEGAALVAVLPKLARRRKTAGRGVVPLVDSTHFTDGHQFSDSLIAQFAVEILATPPMHQRENCDCNGSEPFHKHGLWASPRLWKAPGTNAVHVPNDFKS